MLIRGKCTSFGLNDVSEVIANRAEVATDHLDLGALCPSRRNGMGYAHDVAHSDHKVTEEGVESAHRGGQGIVFLWNRRTCSTWMQVVHGSTGEQI